MDNKTVKRIGRRKAGTWGKPHLHLRRKATRASRTILRRVLTGGRSELVKED